MKRQFRILIVEDNEMFKDLLTSQLKWYTGEMALHGDYTLIVDSFASADDCLRNLKTDTDIAFLDYYLEQGKTAVDLIEPLMEKNKDCKVIIISQAHEARKAVSLLKGPPIDFIYKDNHAISKMCLLAEDRFEEKLRTVN